MVVVVAAKVGWRAGPSTATAMATVVMAEVVLAALAAAALIAASAMAAAAATTAAVTERQRRMWRLWSACWIKHHSRHQRAPWEEKGQYRAPVWVTVGRRSWLPPLGTSQEASLRNYTDADVK